MHRSQESRYPSPDARHRAGAGVQVRRGADAVERDGCPLRQLRETGRARAGRARHRRAGDEAYGRSVRPRERHRAARPDGGRRARREVRAVQNDPSFRWDIPESTMAGVRRCVLALSDWERWEVAWRAGYSRPTTTWSCTTEARSLPGPWSSAGPRLR